MQPFNVSKVLGGIEVTSGYSELGPARRCTTPCVYAGPAAA
jgi:hypothetical protein